MNSANPRRANKVPASKTEKIAAAILLPLLLLGLWFVWNSTHDSRVAEINALLQADAEIAAYPYRFRVVALRDHTAVVTSPRNAQSSILRALKIIEPELNLTNPDSPEVIAAQKRLASVQKKAKRIVLSQPDIERIDWRLDRNWLRLHGVQPD